MDKIELTIEEEKLFQEVLSLNFDEDYDVRISKLESARKLTESLLDRKAIPERRIKYFTDKEFQTGRKHKSRKEIFESNGTSGTDIFRHPHFIKHLTYFIEGANLNQELKSKIQRIVSNNHYQDDAITKIITFLKSDGAIPTDKSRREDFVDEVFKLIVDLEIESSYCHQLRNKIRG